MPNDPLLQCVKEIVQYTKALNAWVKEERLKKIKAVHKKLKTVWVYFPCDLLGGHNWN